MLQSVKNVTNMNIVYILKQTDSSNKESSEFIVGVFSSPEAMYEYLEKQIDEKNLKYFKRYDHTKDLKKNYICEEWEIGHSKEKNELNILLGTADVINIYVNHSKESGVTVEDAIIDEGFFQYKEKSFNTEAERSAYIEGIQDGSAWGEYIFTEKLNLS